VNIDDERYALAALETAAIMWLRRDDGEMEREQMRNVLERWLLRRGVNWRAEPEKEPKTVMLFPNGREQRSFHCEECGANCFVEQPLQRYRCNGCGTRYIGE
jgi:hypothetical protein